MTPYLDKSKTLAKIFANVYFHPTADDWQALVEKLSCWAFEAVGQVWNVLTVLIRLRLDQVDHFDRSQGSFAASGHQELVEFWEILVLLNLFEVPWLF